MASRTDDTERRAAPSDSHTAATVYAANFDWRVVPIAPGQKRPTLPNWSQAATTDRDVIDAWWTGLYRGHGVGIATGPDTGLWVLDVDIADDKDGAQSLASLQEDHGRLPRTVTAITGSGGLHLLFAWDPDHPVTNGDAARLGPGLDIRGAGGQIVVAPSTHPNGQPYRWQDGREPWTLAVAPAPAWFYDIIHPAPPAAAPETAGGVPVAALQGPPAADGDSIADWVRHHYDFADELHRDSWTVHHHQGDDTHWTRPGKATRDGSSAVLHGTDGPLVIFTTEIPPSLAGVGTPTTDGSGVTVSLFDYLAGARFAGDRQALARTARAARTLLEAPAHTTSTTTPTPDPPAGPAPLTLDGDRQEGGGFVDLGDWWDRSEPARHADVLTRTDGTALLYTADLNWIYGDSGSGKTWIALAAAAQLLADGHHITWIHYEDPTPATIIGRLKTLGIPRTTAVDQFHYYDPAGAPIDWPALIQACVDRDVTWVTLDSVGEALNAAGLNEDADTEVGPWINHGPRAAANAGLGVVVVDHGTKAQNQKLHPSGSKRKRAAVTGTALLVEPIVAPTVDRDGMLRLTCAKDRHGNHQQGSTVGIAHLRHDLYTGHTTITITDSSEAEMDDDSDATRIREAVRTVTANPGKSKNQIQRIMAGTASSQKKADAINTAIEQGLIRVEHGPNRTHYLHPAEQDDLDP